jgi:hypothetical protein
MLLDDDNMATGRRKRIMIACVTFETIKVTEPIKFYETSKVHIIHYIKDPTSPKSRMYVEFYDRVCELIRNNDADAEIAEHNVRVSDFSSMLRTVLNIIESERTESIDCDIFVNISSGTSEYAAASAIASMMKENITAFSVNTKDYTITDYDDIKTAYYDNDVPIGLTKTVYDPTALTSYKISIPQEHLVRALRILDERNQNKLSTKGPQMIQTLKDREIWFREVAFDNLDDKSKQKLSEAVYYQRDYVNKWIDAEWIQKDELTKRYRLTDKGKTIIDTFYVGLSP